MNEERNTRFFALVKKYEELQKQADSARELVKMEMELFKIGDMVQAPVDGVVYKIVVPTGTYIEFRKIDYQRTRKEGETKGSLSMKEAKEAGFVLKGGE
jgi:hypothetical protein